MIHDHPRVFYHIGKVLRRRSHNQRLDHGIQQRQIGREASGGLRLKLLRDVGGIGLEVVGKGVEVAAGDLRFAGGKNRVGDGQDGRHVVIPITRNALESIEQVGVVDGVEGLTILRQEAHACAILEVEVLAACPHHLRGIE